jgi:ferrous iron transport protein B
VEVVDLPGTYGLTAYSPDEVAARDYLLEKRPDVVIHVVDALNLERNLYLTAQILELGVPVVIALNMIDLAEARGLEIHHGSLSRLLGLPVLPTVGNRGSGTDEVLAAAVGLALQRRPWQPVRISYGPECDSALDELEGRITDSDLLGGTIPPRWLALKMLEQDTHTLRRVSSSGDPAAEGILELSVRLAGRILAAMDDETEGVIADHRYGFAAGLVREVMRNPFENTLHFSDRLDSVLTHRFLGPAFMALILFVLFQFTFIASSAPIAWMESLFSWLHGVLWIALPSGFLRSMLVSGIVDGVGGVLGFVPLIMFMFFFIAILEDSGYMARIAFLMDRVFRRFGLHGSSVVPMIVSGGIMGGCAVPGIMAARTLRNPRERFATILSAPFMNCGAKLPVYALLIGAFFPSNEGLMLFLLTVLSWTFALLSARFLRSTILRGESTSFVLELPPYRLPSLKSLLIHSWERTRLYLNKAGTVILLASVVVWALMTFPTLPVEEGSFLGQGELAGVGLSNSIAGRLGRVLEKVTLPLMGFDWKTDVALVGGFAAKEIVVSTLSTAYSMEQPQDGEVQPLIGRLTSERGWNPVMAFALMVFTMLYMPCVATVAVIRRETQSWRWAGFAVLYTTGVAAVAATAVFQLGSLLL